MIQRIQTLYLFAAAILSALSAFFLPLYSLDEVSYAATAHAESFGGFGACMAIFSGSILLYSNRKRQLLVVRMGMLTGLIILGYIIYLIQGNGAEASWGAAVPFVLIVLSFMASKNIQKDETKVRSLDRLR